jgi:hypothetical protein
MESGRNVKGGKRVRKNVPKKNSAKRQEPTRRRKRDHRQRSLETRPAAEMISPIPKSQGETQPELEKRASDVPSMRPSGGSQGTAGTKAITSESIAALFDDGLDLDGESVQDLENAGEADYGEIGTRETSREEHPGYKNRNRI